MSINVPTYLVMLRLTNAGIACRAAGAASIGITIILPGPAKPDQEKCIGKQARPWRGRLMNY